jgi:hypothetical protein
MKIKSLFICCIVLSFIVSCGSGADIDDLVGKWKLVGENCSLNGVCRNKTKEHIWTFSEHSKKDNLVIFQTTTGKSYVFKGRKIYVMAAEIIPFDNIKFNENTILVKKDKNNYLKLEKIIEE